MRWRLAVLSIGTAFAVLAPATGAAGRPLHRQPIAVQEASEARIEPARPSETNFPFGAADAGLLAVAAVPAVAFALRRRRLPAASTPCDSYTAA